MTQPYRRTKAQMNHDFAESKKFEAQVAEALGEFVVDQSDSNTKIDFWVPGFFLDVKEKRQKLSDRWWLLKDVGEKDTMVLDELGVRKLMQHYPYGYFLIRDAVLDRMFLASATELATVPRARVNRVQKGKLVYDLRNFRPLDSIADVYRLVMEDLVEMPWKQSPCVGQLEPEQV